MTTSKNYNIFRECDGYWRAVRQSPTGYGYGHNVAPYNCRTRKEAEEAARDDRRELLLAETERQATGGAE